MMFGGNIRPFDLIDFVATSRTKTWGCGGLAVALRTQGWRPGPPIQTELVNSTRVANQRWSLKSTQQEETANGNEERDEQERSPNPMRVMQSHESHPTNGGWPIQQELANKGHPIP